MPNIKEQCFQGKSPSGRGEEKTLEQLEKEFIISDKELFDEELRLTETLNKLESQLNDISKTMVKVRRELSGLHIMIRAKCQRK